MTRLRALDKVEEYRRIKECHPSGMLVGVCLGLINRGRVTSLEGGGVVRGKCASWNSIPSRQKKTMGEWNKGTME